MAEDTEALLRQRIETAKKLWADPLDAWVHKPIATAGEVADLLLVIDNQRTALREAVEDFGDEVPGGNPTVAAMRKAAGMPHTWDADAWKWK